MSMATELHVTSPLMRGELVLRVQKRLAALGYAPGRVDGVYGPTTEAAVRAFQATHRLVSDGVVGPDTQAALEIAAPPAPGAAGTVRPPSAIGERALAEAVRHLGVKEEPASSNRTIFGQWYGVDGVPWCNIFVSYCFSVGANHIIASGFQGAGVRAGKGCAYVPTTEAWLRAAGLWVGRTEPQPGDIAIYNWDGGRPDHIGIIERVLAPGEFESIEGNTALGNDSNGGQVMRRHRFSTQVDGFGRVV
jgi:hypothetical protein